MESSGGMWPIPHYGFGNRVIKKIWSSCRLAYPSTHWLVGSFVASPNCIKRIPFHLREETKGWGGGGAATRFTHGAIYCPWRVSVLFVQGSYAMM